MVVEPVAAQSFTSSTVCKYAERRPEKGDLYGQSNIFLYWDKALAGMEARMPSIVSACLESWCSQNPTWRVHLLSREAESHYLSEACLALADRCKAVQAWSDVVRTDLLRQYGGAWADATSLCVAPLDDFLPDKRAFTLFRRPQGNYCNWFIYAPYKCPLLKQFARIVYDGICIQKRNWFWWHDTFSNFIGSTAHAHLQASHFTCIDVTGEHMFVPYKPHHLNRLCVDLGGTRDRIASARVLKMSWREDFTQYSFWPILVEMSIVPLVKAGHTYEVVTTTIARATADIESSVIRTLERGDQVKVEQFGDCRNHVLVSHHGIVGWISVVAQRGNLLVQPIFKRKALEIEPKRGSKRRCVIPQPVLQPFEQGGTCTTAAQGLQHRGKRMILVSSKQSGVPGVSWQSKLGAWQVSWYEEKKMKKKYFHVRHFMNTSNMFCEAEADALRAAIEFRKGLERSGIAKAKRVENPQSGVH